jgi:hypothetical protein
LHRAPDDYAQSDRKVVRVTAGRCVPSAPKESLEQGTAESLRVRQAKR